ncbi:hypothetical protein [Desulforamulus aquiferis]|uniref:Sporulation membrane protein YtrI C-terminal domain-containing protein n=1 Tax=Desulforamulus aquiferis TaxID=1397668 RepID=A0AAW7ZJN7_9FIRM|nr:hypothetical protein [Desulforamulus aquiferis]MDO7789145.1 hypothetical protein [Desulforamulus aquiferis]RYD02681.1 hypothetical protein N752_23795 [Desulforamulus aquiferis]
MRGRIFARLALVVLGILLGAAGTNIIIGKQVDHLTLANVTLQDQLEDLEEELDKLKENPVKERKHIITSVETFLILTSKQGITDYDEIRVALEASEKVEEWLKPLIGQEVEGLDTLWIPSIVDNREIEANGNKYLLKTYLVVINEKITVYVKATLIKGEGGAQ